MLHCKNISSTAIVQLVKETLWNLVLYFIYFFTLLFWIRFIGVSAQGNRGVVINNQKFDDSSGIQYAQTHQSSTIQPPIIRFTTTTQVNISCENVSKILEKSVERQKQEINQIVHRLDNHNEPNFNYSFIFCRSRFM